MGRRGARRWWLVGALAMAVCQPSGPAAAKEGEMGKTPVWQSVGISGGGAMYQPTFSPADPNWLLLSCDMSGAYRSLDGAESWEMIHYRQLLGSTSVRPAFHSTDPNVAYAVSGWGGGLKVTTDKGATWREVAGAPQGITAIALDPGRPNVMLVATHEGNFRSADQGKTWQQCTGLTGEVLGFHFEQASPARKRVCFAGTSDGVFRSDDGGLTWRGLPAPEPGKVIAFAGGSNAKEQACTLYCTVEATLQDGDYRGGVFRSEDGGTTWVSMMGEGLPRTLRTRRSQTAARATQFEFLATSDADRSIVYAAAPGTPNVYRSDDGGKSWRPLLDLSMSSPGLNVSPSYLLDERGRAGDNVSGLGVSPADANLVAVSDWMSCYVSRNGGKTWTASHTRSAEEAGRRGPGMRWQNNGLVVTTVWHYYLDPFEPERHYIAYTDIGYARSTDAGQTWYWSQERPLRNTTYEIAFDPSVPGKLWAACADLHDIPNDNVISGRHYRARAGGGVAVSTDHGVTWQDTSDGLPQKPIVSVVVDPKSEAGRRTLYASAFEDGVYKSTDDGRTWVKASTGLGAPDTNMRVCRIILHPDGTLFCLITARREENQFLSGGLGLYRSRDGGEHWECITQSHPLLWPKDFDVDPRDSKVIYLGAADADNSQGGLYKTTDGGATWRRVARKGWDCFGATVSVHHPDWVYLCIAEGADDAGLWLSKDAGETWQALDGMPFRNAQRVAFDPSDPSVIYVCTFGGSVWKGPAE